MSRSDETTAAPSTVVAIIALPEVQALIAAAQRAEKHYSDLLELGFGEAAERAQARSLREVLGVLGFVHLSELEVAEIARRAMARAETITAEIRPIRTVSVDELDDSDLPIKHGAVSAASAASVTRAFHESR
jgi:hypothetical protein